MLFSDKIIVQYTLLLPPADDFWIINVVNDNMTAQLFNNVSK